MSDIFEKLFGDRASRKETPAVDPSIAASVWQEGTPIFKKLPKADDEAIKIKAGDFRRVMRQAYVAGFERATK